MTIKELLTDYVTYNLWANKRIMEALGRIPRDLLRKASGGSFATVLHTVHHIWMAEKFWYTRINGVSPTSFPVMAEEMEFEDLRNGLLAQSRAWSLWIEEKEDRSFSSFISYKTTKGVDYQHEISEIILHCMNHSTYHRGQIVTYIRQSGELVPPQTDYVYYRRLQRQ